MKSFPMPLSTKEEQWYLLEWKNGDKEARNVLIERNMRLVAHIVKKYNYGEHETEDLISVGTIGLIKAINTFQMDKGIRLATYASCCIENELLMLFRSEKKKGKDMYLSDTIGSDKEGNEVHMLDVLESDSVDVVERLELEENTQKLYRFMDQVLTKREMKILKLRYGLLGEEEQTQREIARNLNISRSYVSRIEKKAIGKLKQCFDLEREKKYG